MRNSLDPTIFYDSLTLEQREALLKALETDPALATAYHHWRRVRAAVHRSLEEHIHDRDLLVLYALDAGARQDLLTPQETEALHRTRPALDKAIQTHPALADVILRIQKDCRVFEQQWAVHFGRESASKRLDRGSIPTRVEQSPLRRWIWRGAVGIVVLAFAVVWTFMSQRDRNLIAVETGEGEVQTITLGDGSSVRLMGHSILYYIPSRNATTFRRFARLSGRAVFEIEQDSHGFIVETPTARATVLGTTFGIQAADSVTEFVLVYGRLAVASLQVPDEYVYLEPGQKTRVAVAGLPSIPAPVNLAEELVWAELFVFKATSILSVAEQLGTFYDVEITVGPNLEAEEVTGTFDSDQTLDEILQIIALAIEADVEKREDGTYRLVPKDR